MVKVITCSVVVLLLAGSVAFGQLDSLVNQQQLVLLPNTHTLSNSITLFGVNGAASSTVTIPSLLLTQSQAGNSNQTLANQTLAGSFTQVGSATTNGSGATTLTQTMDAQTVGMAGFIDPGQNQNKIEGDGDAAQSEGVQIAAGQTLDKDQGGPATVTGLNTVTMGLSQNALVVGTTAASESAGIVGVQSSTLTGAANSSGTVVAGMNIVVLQKQSTN